eukprot:8267599-Alexandrium_andersonii.AAC.1
MQVDKIMREAWGRIYAGNIGCPHAQVATWYEKYGADVFQSAEYQVPPITASDVEECFAEAGPSAGGPDHWRPAELRLISRQACQALADMLNSIESGASWPDALRVARVAIVEKPGGDPLSPLGYRLLTVLPVVYRRWASIRLRHVDDWVSSWALPEMYAGVPGRGAQRAWWETAWRAEM